jgi:hypothetical protein
MTQDISELLPWYANGTLSQDERNMVEDRLREDTELRAELVFCETLREEVLGLAADIPGDIGLSATMEKISVAQAVAPYFMPAQDRLMGRLRDFFALNGTRRGAYSLGLALIVAQGFAISFLVQERSKEYGASRAKAVVPAASGPFVKLSFMSDAKEIDIRFLMIQVGASIVGGPTQLGDYYLYLKPERIDWAVQQFKKSPIVDSATMIAILPVIKE